MGGIAQKEICSGFATNRYPDMPTAKDLAVEVVIGEPVSASHFPVSREDTGKFAAFGLEMTKAPRLSEGNSIVCEPNSLAAKAGKICGRTGNPKAHNSEHSRSWPIERYGVIFANAVLSGLHHRYAWICARYGVQTLNFPNRRVRSMSGCDPKRTLPRRHSLTFRERHFLRVW